MNWTEQIDHYGEIGARAREWSRADAAWREWIEEAS